MNFNTYLTCEEAKADGIIIKNADYGAEVIIIQEVQCIGE
jgi:hypothetical protein